MSEDLGQKRVKTASNPRRLHLELHYEDPVRLEQSLGSVERFGSVDIIVNAYVRVMRTGGVRIKQREDDHVKSIAAVFDIAARIVIDLCYPGGFVRLLEMKLFAQFKDQRINLDRRHLRCAIPQRGGHIVSHAGAQNQYRTRLLIEMVRNVVGIPRYGNFLE